MSSSCYEINAYAKINLFLKICGKLPNGYHKLFTIMQEVDLKDNLTVTIDDSKDETITVTDPEGNILSENNLCYTAADKFYGYMGRKFKKTGFPAVTITLDKHIPVQSGMGGGSSDAAAVLLVMQKHFNDPFTDSEMVDLAVSIGADVPFFLYGGTCLCEMVGEKITLLDPLSGSDIVLLKPEEGVSTAECFAEADRYPSDDEMIRDYKEFTAALAADSAEKKEMKDLIAFLKNRADCSNDLQKPAEKMVPVISALISELEGQGAELARMTGSGSAVFGIFDDEETAENAASAIRESHADDGTVVLHLKTI